MFIVHNQELGRFSMLRGFTDRRFCAY